MIVGIRVSVRVRGSYQHMMTDAGGVGWVGGYMYIKNEYISVYAYIHIYTYIYIYYIYIYTHTHTRIYTLAIVAGTVTEIPLDLTCSLTSSLAPCNFETAETVSKALAALEASDAFLYSLVAALRRRVRCSSSCRCTYKNEYIRIHIFI